MARSIPALVNRKMLTWARKEAGYSIESAAEKARLPVNKLVAWEEGDSLPTVSQAEKLAKLYARSYSVFYLSKPPETIPLASEYRRLFGVKPGEESPELRVALRQMIHRRKIALDLLEEFGKKPDLFSLKAYLTENPEIIGKRLRKELGITLKEQFEWPNEFHAWSAWRATIEDFGVMVFQFYKVALTEVRGISLFDFPLPVIGVNNKEIPASKPFSLLHELIHIMLANAQEEKPAILDNRPAEEWAHVERFAEAAAGAVLMPTDALSAEPLVSERSAYDNLFIQDVVKLARRYKVTPKAVATRLLQLNYCSSSVYSRWSKEWEAYLTEHPPKTGGGFATPAQKALNRNGYTFTGLVLDALSLGRITAVKASRYLELNFPHIETLRRNLAMARAVESEA